MKRAALQAMFDRWAEKNSEHYPEVELIRCYKCNGDGRSGWFLFFPLYDATGEYIRPGYRYLGSNIAQAYHKLDILQEIPF